jgi:hypothetical protein
MKKEDFLSSQDSTGRLENKGEGRQQQKSPTTNVSNDQEEVTEREAGLGRYLMADIDDLGGTSRRDDYGGGDNESMTDKNSNGRTDK